MDNRIIIAAGFLLRNAIAAGLVFGLTAAWSAVFNQPFDVLLPYCVAGIVVNLMAAQLKSED